MIPQTVLDEFNKQINEETFSAYLYWSMAAWFESQNLPGFAAWMRCQVQEELLHASKFFDQINERSGVVVLTGIEGPKTEWESPLNAFEEAYAHEQHISGRISHLMDVATEAKDHASQQFLQWFVSEQVEEEATADGVVQLLKRAQDAPGALFMIDRELGQRVFTPPAPAAE